MSDLMLCKICGYTSQEVTIINELCSVHTCEFCGDEGYASGDEGRILCEPHGVLVIRATTCAECGNDDATEGQTLCMDCLETSKPNE
jgi:hypothetical protein